MTYIKMQLISIMALVTAIGMFASEGCDAKRPEVASDSGATSGTPEVLDDATHIQDGISAYLSELDANLLGMLRIAFEPATAPGTGGIEVSPTPPPLADIVIDRYAHPLGGDVVAFRGQVNHTGDLDVMLGAFGIYNNMAARYDLPTRMYFEIDLSPMDGPMIRGLMTQSCFVEALTGVDTSGSSRVGNRD